MSNKVESWFETLSSNQKRSLEDLRQLIITSNTKIVEEIKWGQPCYSINHLVCYLQKSENHVNIGFQQGAHLDDPEKLLVGDGKNMRHIKIGFTQKINNSAISGLIRNAIEFDEKQNR